MDGAARDGGTVETSRDDVSGGGSNTGECGGGDDEMRHIAVRRQQQENYYSILRLPRERNAARNAPPTEYRLCTNYHPPVVIAKLR